MHQQMPFQFSVVTLSIASSIALLSILALSLLSRIKGGKTVYLRAENNDRGWGCGKVPSPGLEGCSPVSWKGIVF